MKLKVCIKLHLTNYFLNDIVIKQTKYKLLFKHNFKFDIIDFYNKNISNQYFNV